MNTPNTNRFDGRDDDAQFREEWLSAYLDDQLSPAERQIVEQRIATDPETSLMFGDLERIRSLVGSLPGWNGRALQVPVEVLSTPYNSNENSSVVGPAMPPPAARSADAQQLDLQQLDSQPPEADFHDELQPLLEQVAPPGSAAAPSVRLPGSRRASRSSHRGWWRPLALVASLLFAVGLGLLLWPAVRPWEVASSSRIEDAPAADSERTFPESGPSAAAETVDPGAAAGSTMEAASSPASSPASSAAAPENDTAAGAVMNDGPSGGEMLRSRSLPEVENQRDDFAPATRSMEARSMRSAGESSAGNAAAMGAAAPAASPAANSLKSQSLEPQESQPLGKTAAAQTRLQFAHSDAWQASELSTGLARLAPLLNLPLAEQPQGVLEDQGSARQTPSASPTAAGTNIPVAVVSIPTASSGADQLAELLQQSSVKLTGIAAPPAAANLGGLVPYGTDSSQAPATVALFVNGGQAGEILQAAEQSGKLKAPPVWIRSSTNSTATLDDDQQVIVVLSPQ